MRFPLRVYVAGPLRGTTPYHTRSNVEAARHTAEMLWRMGYAVFCPHLNTEGMIGMLDATDDLTDDFFIDGDIRWLMAADLVVFLPGWKDSKGAKTEHYHAKLVDIPIFYCREPERHEQKICYLADSTGQTLPTARAVTRDELKTYTQKGEET